ncbi:MAG TPA: hypothetical protein VGG74_05165 [Kofleriaceae bacterium]
MRWLAIAVLVLVPRIAFADWRAMEDPDCRCELALPDKPLVSARPSPWPKLPWHRSEVRASPTEWYAVSYIAFDKAPPAKALDTALAGLHGTIVSRTPAANQLDARIKLDDGTTIAVRLVVHERRIYAVEAGDVAKGTKPDKLFAGFHAWTDKDAPPEGTYAPMTGDVVGGGGLGELGGGHGNGNGTGEGRGRAPAPPRGNMRMGQIDIQDGPLQAAAVRRSLLHAHDKLVACYEKRLAAVPTLGGGDVHFGLTVEGSGKASHVTANGLDEKLDRCLEGAFGRIVFPQSSDGKPTTALLILGFETAS